MRLLPLGVAAALLGVGAILLSTLDAARAQNGNEPASQLILDRFPEIGVSFLCEPPSGSLAGYTLYEDGQAQTLVSATVRTIASPARGAILLDIYRNADGSVPQAVLDLLSQEGEDNDLGNYLIQVVDYSDFTAPEDTLGILMPETDLKTPRHIASPITFTFDVNMLFNALVALNPETSVPQLPAQGTTRLKDLLSATIDLMEPAPDRHDFVILFSDGTNNSSDATPSEVIAKANAHGIPVHTVYIPTYEPGDRDFLDGVAAGTGGIALSATLTESIIQLLTDSYASMQQCIFTYRTQQAQPGRIIVAHGQDEQWSDAQVFDVPPLNVAAPVVTITHLLTEAQSLFTKTEDLALRFAVTWGWKNYPDRRITSILYETRNLTGVEDAKLDVLERITETVGGYTLETNGLAVDSYLVQVHITDDLGLGNSDVHPFTLLNAPPPVLLPVEEVTPPPTPWERVTAFANDVWKRAQGPFTPVQALSLIFAAILLTLLVLLLWGFRPKGQARDWEQSTPVTRTQPIKPVEAVLVRVRRDRNAPPLRHSVPLLPNDIIEQDKMNAVEEYNVVTVKIPENLFERANSSFKRNGHSSSFGEEFRATLLFYPNQNVHVIRRPPLLDPNAPSGAVAQLAPIRIQAAETASPFDLEADETHRLHEGDILQLGETHYKFVRSRMENS